MLQHRGEKGMSKWIRSEAVSASDRKALIGSSRAWRTLTCVSTTARGISRASATARCSLEARGRLLPCACVFTHSST